ncbi:hypothetical protein QBC38DRAFT_505689, partial [Podospora fimiseda]
MADFPALDTIKTIQEIATVMRSCEKDGRLKAFYIDVEAYCILIQAHCRYANLPRILPLRSLETLFERGAIESLTNETFRKLKQDWDILRAYTWTFGGLQDRDSFIRSIAVCEEELRAACSEDKPDGIADEKGSYGLTNADGPSYAVWHAAQSILKALTACKNCYCIPAHNFGARLCLGTYRKPTLNANKDNTGDHEINFDMFLSLEQDWHEARVHTAREITVKFSTGGGEQPNLTQTNAERAKERAMKINKLCEPITKHKTKTEYRLELKVKNDQLFKLQSERSTSLIDKTKEPVTLQQVVTTCTRGGYRLQG